MCICVCFGQDKIVQFETLSLGPPLYGLGPSRGVHVIEVSGNVFI